MGKLLSLGMLALLAGLCAAPVRAADPTANDVVARGKYLTDLGDCASCHTHNGGARFAGGRYMGMPFGDLSTPNITPDKEYGIGKWSDDQFVAVFHGIGVNGQHLYPAMPYPWYTRMKREDILAIKAYLFTQPAVHDKRPPNKVFFPFTFRPAIALWDAGFVPSGTFADNPQHSAQVNRGDYIVNVFEHCSECHNGRTLLGNVPLALPFMGGVIDHWASPNITNNKLTGLGRYSDDQLFHYLKDGYADGMGTAVGPMRETVDVSLSKLRDEDIRAIIAYLRTLNWGTKYMPRKLASYQTAQAPGSDVYFGYCASCHGADGRGMGNLIPALDGNGMVTAAGPQNIIAVVLQGLEAKGTYGPMPGLGTAMTDKQIRDVSNFVRQAWSNAAPPNASLALVQRLRFSGTSAGYLMNGRRPGGCPTLDQPELQKLLANSSNGITAEMQHMRLATMLPTVNSILGKIKSAAPDLKTEDIVNGLTVAYCPIVASDSSVSQDNKLWQLTHFSARVFTQLTTNGKY